MRTTSWRTDKLTKAICAANILEFLAFRRGTRGEAQPLDVMHIHVAHHQDGHSVVGVHRELTLKAADRQELDGVRRAITKDRRGSAPYPRGEYTKRARQPANLPDAQC